MAKKKKGAAVEVSTPKDNSPKCPVCGSTLSMYSEHPLVTVDKKKMAAAVRKAHSKLSGSLKDIAEM